MVEPKVEETCISGLILKTTCYVSEILIYIVLSCGVWWLFITAFSLVRPTHNLRFSVFWALPTFPISSFIHYPFPSHTTIPPQWITMVSQTYYVPLDFWSIRVMFFTAPSLCLIYFSSLYLSLLEILCTYLFTLSFPLEIKPLEEGL